jgi:hypothetical protein
MKRELHLWRRIWQSVSFDTVSGQGTRRWFRRASSQARGWATKHEGKWFALWSDGQHVIFQIGTDPFLMSEACQCENSRSGETRKFRIKDEKRIIFELYYKARDRDNDPSFDLTDLEQEDYFFYASRLWNDREWRDDMARKWAP